METKELLQILACPKCLGDLTALEDNGEAVGLSCTACAVVYPVLEHIPIMLVEEAVNREAWTRDHPAATERR